MGYYFLKFVGHRVAELITESLPCVESNLKGVNLNVIYSTSQAMEKRIGNKG